ncbi:hypothetical protein Y032_0270g841 [Ancylostoma ceylanicum]|uniref:Uncharacterized protein n=1 Tax=Ancylostoma ceylanicum TaxID=53326 RepID=A0A016S9D1_9BILA|nr:hypothetical protein Y032_0270g841 [Ancylostoma ceylanicum]
MIWCGKRYCRCYGTGCKNMFIVNISGHMDKWDVNAENYTQLEIEAKYVVVDENKMEYEFYVSDSAGAHTVSLSAHFHPSYISWPLEGNAVLERNFMIGDVLASLHRSSVVLTWVTFGDVKDEKIKYDVEFNPTSEDYSQLRSVYTKKAVFPIKGPGRYNAGVCANLYFYGKANMCKETSVHIRSIDAWPPRFRYEFSPKQVTVHFSSVMESEEMYPKDFRCDRKPARRMQVWFWKHARWLYSAETH